MSAVTPTVWDPTIPWKIGDLLGGLAGSEQKRKEASAVTGYVEDKAAEAIPGVAGLSKILNVLTSADFWKRFLTGYAGVMLIILGIVVILAGSRAVREVVGVGASVATKGLVK